MARPINTKKDRYPIMQEDYDNLIKSTKHDKRIDKHTRLKLLRAYTLLFHSGCRISEITSLTVSDIASIISNHNYILTKTKTNTTQMLRFTSKSIEVLKALDISDIFTYIFYKNQKDRSISNDKAMSVSGLTKLINKHLALKLNELYTSHSFRSGYVTRIVETTGNITIAQKLARHRDIKTTMKYIGATPKQLDDALERVFNEKGT